MSQSETSYARFRSSVERLTGHIIAAKACFDGLNMAGWVESSDKISARLASERFRVIVLGEFKRGKSTFINAMLGREVLPAFATPCTAVINEIKWGDSPRAVLHFRNPPPQELAKGLPEETLAHLRNNCSQQVPSLPIAINDLERFVVIPDPTKDQSASVAETPYERVEIYWPLPLLKNGVEIIDSPGLNEHGSRTKVTMDYLGKIDAVIFVLSVHALASQSELAVVDHDVRAAGHEYIFFVCNRFDELRKQADRDRVMSYSFEQLAPRTALARDGVFFASALDAVIGREEDKPELLERSNIPAFETALAKFLVNERGRIKLLQPARQLAQGLKIALFEIIPNQRSMLKENIDELEQRYAAAQPRLIEADSHRHSIITRLEKSRARLRDAVRNAATMHLRDVASLVPMLANQLDVDSRISAFKIFNIEGQVKTLAEDVLRGITPPIEAHTAEWRQKQLQPMVQDALEEIADVASDSVRDFMIELDHIRTDITRLATGTSLSDSRISPLERVLSSAGGLIIGGAGSAIEGATMGYQGVIRGLVPQILISVVGIAVLHLNPLAVIAVMTGVGFFRAFRQGDALTNRAKGEIGKSISDAMIATIPEQADQIAASVFEQTESIVAQVDSGLTQEIQSVREQVETVMATKQAGVDEVNRQLQRLDSNESQLKKLDVEVAEFILRLAHVNV